MGLPPPGGSLPAALMGCDGSRLSYRFNARPMTMQKYHCPCPGSSPHRFCFSVSEAVASPEGETVPRVASPDRNVREELLFSFQGSKRGREIPLIIFRKNQNQKSGFFRKIFQNLRLENSKYPISPLMNRLFGNAKLTSILLKSLPLEIDCIDKFPLLWSKFF